MRWQPLDPWRPAVYRIHAICQGAQRVPPRHFASELPSEADPGSRSLPRCCAPNPAFSVACVSRGATCSLRSGELRPSSCSAPPPCKFCCSRRPLFFLCSEPGPGRNRKGLRSRCMLAFPRSLIGQRARIPRSAVPRAASHVQKRKACRVGNACEAARAVGGRQFRMPFV
jgi:hypothetical protein